MVMVIGFVLWVALSKAGSIRLVPDDSRPQYKLGTWAAMLFAAGVGIDMLFFSVTGPVVQYLTPPSGEGASAAGYARRCGLDNVPLRHCRLVYLCTAWCMAMGLFLPGRWGMPLSIRAALYPLLGMGKRSYRPWY